MTQQNNSLLMERIKRRNSNVIFFAVLFLLSIFLLILNLLVGSVKISFTDVFNAIFSTQPSINQTIVLDYRWPQAITAVLAGASLAVSGLFMQTLFRNPLADPSILGISSGSSLGVALVVLLTAYFAGDTLSGLTWIPTIGIPLAAFIGAILVLFLILSLSNRLKNMVSLILIGIMIAYIASALTDMLKYLSPKEGVHSFVIWGLGSFSSVGKSQLPFFCGCVVIGLSFSAIFSKTLNAILLGDRYAENLGVNIKRSSFWIIMISGFLTAIVTAYCGPIAFIGLAVPHIARFVFRTSDHKVLIPACILAGIDLALLCNLISRLPCFDGNLPINSVNAIIGAPIVIWVIFHRQKTMQR